MLRLRVKQPVELVAKMILPEKGVSLESFTNIMCESHMIKYMDNKEYVVDIFEEIIEFNQSTNQMENYMVLVEQATNDLSKIKSIWLNRDLSFQHQEEYSDEKFFYFMLMATKALDYVHSKNVFYCDMKPANLLIFRDYAVKIGDFGVSIKLSEELCGDSYYLKGLTKGYALPVLEEEFANDSALPRDTLIRNDYFALFKTFSEIQSQLENHEFK